MKDENKRRKKNEKLYGYIVFAICLTLVLFIIGILGFYLFEKPDWIKSIYSTAAVMSVVGIDEPKKDAAKIFASFYMMAIGLGYIFLMSYIVTSLLESNIV